MSKTLTWSQSVSDAAGDRAGEPSEILLQGLRHSQRNIFWHRSPISAHGAQRSAKASFDESSAFRNTGRILCITQFQDMKHFEQVVTKVKNRLREANMSMEESSAEEEEAQSLSHLEICFLHCSLRSGGGKDFVIPEDTSPYDGPNMSVKVYGVEAGKEFSKKLLYLALTHYELASTTVTGIPMKEEQNASSSANYDVDSSTRPKHMSDSLGTPPSSFKRTRKWCTPRGSSADLHHCTGAVRITPTDVNSRPSSCLTNFLLSGRSVMLEMPRRASGAKALSHLMTSHGGEIFIHTLSLSRSILEDPPSITEGSGGRVTDYRISDLGDLMKANRLAPGFTNQGHSSLERAKDRLSRFGAYFPYTISSTTIFNMAACDPL
ncbi:Uncharacterized protein FKW44_023977 [Caligus rogercresseyi]|uniref:Protein asunder n=1 Tax=Caligus rogercresseyi TaxID=217165 RepID=A0A7T8GQ82_CALRO|nr:Uncharacterized protein FKW44_023977 [Caligus rogercresseyi]